MTKHEHETVGVKEINTPAGRRFRATYRQEILGYFPTKEEAIRARKDAHLRDRYQIPTNATIIYEACGHSS